MEIKDNPDTPFFEKMNPYYKDYSEYLQEFFPGIKVQKISVNAGFSCPNRDGTISRGGCIYCLNDSFTPGYCMEGSNSVTAQIAKGKQFFARKYPSMKYLAYFQSFTNTFASPETLEPLYREAMATEDIVGIVVGTRPDCLPQPTVEMLGRLGQELPVFVELGAESSHDATLQRINRGHYWKSVEDAAMRLNDTGLHVGVHFIAGLPGERRNDILQTIERVCSLPIESIKLHQMQVLRSTPLAHLYKEGQADLWEFSAEEYMDLCTEIIQMVPRQICIERFLSQAPPDMLIYPKWGLKNHEFVNLLHNRLKASDHPS